MKIVKQTKEFIVIQSETGACFKININEFLVILKLLSKCFFINLSNKLKTIFTLNNK